MHTAPDDTTIYTQLLGATGGSSWLTSAALQVHGGYAAAIDGARALFALAGRTLAIDLDEIGSASSGLTDGNHDHLRKLVLWDVLLSGGNIAWYCGYHDLPLGGDIRLEDFRTRDAMWRASRFARELLGTVPFWRMDPADQLVNGATIDSRYAGPEVLASPGESYVVYFANATATGALDLSAAPSTARFDAQWFDPRGRAAVGAPVTLQGGGAVPLPQAPAPRNEDWVLRVVRR